MCNCNKNVLVFNLRNGNYCGCCGENQNNPGTGIELPSGGENGDVLAKQDNGLIWKEGSGSVTGIENIVIPIVINDQTQFNNAFTSGKTLLELKIDGVAQIKDIDYTVTDNDILWISTDFNLKSSLRLTIIIY